jgi:hypothetical protein
MVVRYLLVECPPDGVSTMTAFDWCAVNLGEKRLSLADIASCDPEAKAAALKAVREFKRILKDDEEALVSSLRLDVESTGKKSAHFGDETVRLVPGRRRVARIGPSRGRLISLAPRVVVE